MPLPGLYESFSAAWVELGAGGEIRRPTLVYKIRPMEFWSSLLLPPTIDII